MNKLLLSYPNVINPLVGNVFCCLYKHAVLTIYIIFVYKNSRKYTVTHTEWADNNSFTHCEPK
jgi:5-methylcytosine-specific restriction endonuclease McrA